MIRFSPIIRLSLTPHRHQLPTKKAQPNKQPAHMCVLSDGHATSMRSIESLVLSLSLSLFLFFRGALSDTVLYFGRKYGNTWTRSRCEACPFLKLFDVFNYLNFAVMVEIAGHTQWSLFIRICGPEIMPRFPNASELTCPKRTPPTQSRRVATSCPNACHPPSRSEQRQPVLESGHKIAHVSFRPLQSSSVA